MWTPVATCLKAGLLVLALVACRPTAADSALDDAGMQSGQRFPADERTSTGSRDPQDEVPLWRATRYEQLQHAAQDAGAPLGVLLVAGAATDICIADTVGMQKAYNTRREDPGFTHSLAEIRAFQARFCPAETLEHRQEAERMEIQRRMESGDAEARLISALLEADEHMGHEDREALRRAAENRVAVTRSPAIYEALQISLLDDVFFDPAMVVDRPFGMGDEALRDAWGHAVLLASCERFGHCGPGSLTVYRVCMPHHCRRGLDVRGYVRDRLSRDGYEEAQRRARQLLAKT